MTLEQFYQLLTLFSGVGIVVFIALFFIKAGYGMFRTERWGISVPNKTG